VEQSAERGFTQGYTVGSEKMMIGEWELKLNREFGRKVAKWSAWVAGLMLFLAMTWQVGVIHFEKVQRTPATSCGNLVCEGGEELVCPDCVPGTVLVNQEPILNLKVDKGYIYYSYCTTVRSGKQVLRIYRMTTEGLGRKLFYEGELAECTNDLLVDDRLVYVAGRETNSSPFRIFGISLTNGERVTLAEIRPGKFNETFHHMMKDDYMLYWTTLTAEGQGQTRVYRLGDEGQELYMVLSEGGVSRDIIYHLKDGVLYYAYSGWNSSEENLNKGIALAFGNNRLVQTDRTPDQLRWVASGRTLDQLATLTNTTNLPNIYRWSELFYFMPERERSVYDRVFRLNLQTDQAELFISPPFQNPDQWTDLKVDFDDRYVYYLYRGPYTFIAKKLMG